MRITVLLLLIAACLLRTVEGADPEPEVEEEADEMAKAEANKGSENSHAGDVDVHNGEEQKQQPDSSDPHKGGMEVIVQELAVEVKEEGGVVSGNVDDKLEQVAKTLLKESNGVPSVSHTVLELAHDNPARGTWNQRQGAPLSSRWEKGIIIYTFTDIRKGEKAESAAGQEAIRAAMKYYEAITCLKFYQVSATVHADHGLKHTSFLRYIVPDAGGCWSFVGRGGNNGQGISCCGNLGVALHEIGHAIGYVHEQDRSDRELFVQMHPENANPTYAWVFNGAPATKGVNVHPYDLGSMMHYGAYGFSGNGLKTLSVKDPTVAFLLGKREGKMSHYDIMGTNKYYECNAKCTTEQKAVVCENDGFMDFRCKCKCSGHFMGDRCELLYKPTGSTPWPTGSYGLPDSVDGCPGADFTIGSRTHATEWGSKIGGGGKIKPFAGDLVVDHFCMRKDPAAGTGDWPAGTYCIYQQGDACPKGFQTGWIQFDDANDRASLNAVSGSLPKGVYNQDTKYFYCCRKDASANTRIDLPRAKPFQLFRFGRSCQAINGMKSSAYNVRVDQEDSNTQQLSQAPTPYFSSYYRDVWLYYCYYTPINYDNCGGIIELTDAKPTTTIQTPNYPQNYDNARTCSWLIKAPAGKHLALDFDDFEVQDTINGKCADSVEVRHMLIGQPGQRYCGSGFKRTLLSPKGFAVIIFRSDISGVAKGFKATVRTITDAEQCISTEDFGASYRGAVSYTQHYKECMPWEEVKHCKINPISEKYMFSGLVGNNKCRNPNGLLRPWCFINNYCGFDFCDVCGIAKCYDYFNDCADQIGKDPNYCTKKEAFHGCHKSCKLCGKDQQKTVSSCAPPVVTDKNAVIEPAKAAQALFKFGEKVKLICKKQIDGTPISSEITCMTDGTYSGQKKFCGIVCPDGWKRYKYNCYKLFEKKLFYKEAIAGCKAEKAHLTSIRSAEENTFVNNFVGGREIYHGFNDADRTGTWHWEDGYTGSYKNWMPKQPSGGYWDKCGSMRNGLWNDIYCSIHYPQMYVCKKPFTETDNDFYYCVDENPDCAAIASRNSRFCKENTDFALAHCSRSCGLCPDSECASPGIVENAKLITTDSYVYAGHYFKYSCKAGYTLASGTLERACLRQSGLVGAPPVCKPEGESDSTYGQRLFARSRNESPNKLSVYNTTESNIKRNGLALRWEVYSSRHAVLIAQVWRRLTGTKFLLVGQSMLNLRPNRVNVYNLKSFEGFLVKTGDLLGWYTPAGRQGLSYSACSDTFATRGLYQLSFDNMGDVKVGMQKTIPLVAKCRTYSIALTIGGGAIGTYVNVAAASRGATCSAASSSKELCALAIDGSLAPFNNAWVSNNEGKGASITITFDGTYNLIGARFMQRLAATGQIQRILLTFSDGSSQMVGLNKRLGTSSMDLTASYWDAFDLKKVSSNFAKITVDSVYSTDKNGFIEVEFYSGCMTGWEHFAGNCYKYTKSKVSFSKVLELCKAAKANVLHINTVEEGAFIKTLITDRTWLGINDRATEGTYVWSDGVASAYTNWATGEPNNYGGYEDCATITTSGTWNDIYCGWANMYICEKPLIADPKGPSMTSVGNLAQPRRHKDGANRIIIAKRPENKFTKQGTVTSWKVYGEDDSIMTLGVWRPVTGSIDKFTLVGSNTVQVKKGWVTYLDVPLLWQIKVKPGDVIGMQFPSGPVGVGYDKCNNDVVHMSTFEKGSGWTNPSPGQEVKLPALPSYYACREYAVAAIMAEGVTDPMNVANIASTSLGASCVDDAGNTCGKVIDGDIAPASMWSAAAPVAAHSVKITFSASYGVQYISIMQRFAATAQTKTVTLEFSDGTKQDVVLKQRLGGSHHEVRNAFWDDIEIKKVDTSFIKFTIKDVYTELNNGFVEIKVLAGCATGYTRYKDHCYMLKKDKIKYFAAKDVCVAAGAKFVRVDDAAENAFLKKLAEGQKLWIGFRDDYKGIPGGVWSWELDSTASTYTNWAAGKPSGSGTWGYCATLDSDGLWRDHYCKWFNEYWFVCEKAAPGTAAAAKSNV